MTEQEAEVFAKRIKRVGGLDEVEYKLQQNGRWTFRGATPENIGLQTEHWMEGGYYYELYDPHPCRNDVSLMYQCDAIYPDYSHQSEEAKQFVLQYDHYFRRSLWLSGISIEASAHEKAEWIQDFTHEEIEAWNLKF